MSAPYVVELKGLSKQFGTCVANDDISLKVKPGTIHAVIGENGAGKSTAMKMLYGQWKPDSGEIWIRGEKKNWNSPSDAIAEGIGMVHQHFALAEPYTALENAILGYEPARVSFLPAFLQPVSFESAKAELETLSQRFGLDVPWDKPVHELSVGVLQRIEILKLIYRKASILILDEPTAVLTPQEVTELFVHLRKMAEQGNTILIITHKLKEVMSVADEVTVFRAGKTVSEVAVSETNVEDLASRMVGRKVELNRYLPSQNSVAQNSVGEVVFEAQMLSFANLLTEISFQIRSGEIVGIAGVEGNGQSELLKICSDPKSFFEEENTSGDLKLSGESVVNCSAREFKKRGVGFVPEDRHREALLLNRPLTENFLLGKETISAFSRHGILKSQNLLTETIKGIKAFDVRPPEPQQLARGLSGGNQQKLILAREFWVGEGFEKLKLLIVAQPTRGVDVGAIEAIHAKIRKVRDEGVAVLLISSDLDEVLSLSDRILVFYEGKIAAHFDRKKELSEEQIGLAMTGVRTGASHA